jgi:signal peptidase I
MTGEGETATSPEPASDPEPAPPPGPERARTGGRRRSFWREFPVLLVVALVIALLVKTFVVQAFFIPSGSMQNTLDIGDKVLVNKLAYHFRPIHPGDIIVFDGAGSWDAPVVSPVSGNPAGRVYDATLRPLLRSIGGLFGTAPGQTDYIKRVIGVPGDHVACCNAQGLVTINGVPLHEQGDLYPGNTPGAAPLGESGHFSLIVPAGRLWVLGDHRAISDDSRGHVADPGDGTIPESKVIGRAFLIVWPPSRWRVLRIPQTFQQPGVTSAAAAALPYLPIAAGFAGAIPVTIRRRRRSRRGPRPRC